MYIKYKDKKYYWDIERFKKNMFDAIMLISVIVCCIIAGRL